MTVYLLAGGGTAGHVNPLLATADEIKRRDSRAEILVVGTRSGLESDLVPRRGYELVIIPKLPFPRRVNKAAFQFSSALRRSVASLAQLITERQVDVVVGFGGYAAAPVYLAARRAGIPLVIHEANARPGLANRLGARFTSHVGVAFRGTPLRRARFMGMPLRREIQDLDIARTREEARSFFGLQLQRPTLLVTGGSLGAHRLNRTVSDSAEAIVAAGYQILHITGARSEGFTSHNSHYHLREYCDRMEFAFAAADCVISRSGAATVSEIAALGLPAVLIPYPVGNGEQRLNARDLVEAGGAIVVADHRFVPQWVVTELLPLLADSSRLAQMAAASSSVGVRDGAERMADLIENVVKMA